MRILIVEDDPQTRGGLRKSLMESGHVVDEAATGDDGFALAREGCFDVVVLDRGLPGLHGIALVRQLRHEGVGTPVLMLSGAGKAADRISGLRAGCDDYLAKPYAYSELLARLEALVRRADPARVTRVLEVGDLRLDTLTREVTLAGHQLSLQRQEGLILEILMRNPGRVVSRGMIMESVWPSDFDPRGNIVDMHMHRIRRKIELPGREKLIRTVPGGGYMLVKP